MIHSKCIFVGNIPYDCDQSSLETTLSLVGPIENFEIKNDEVTGKSRGFGFCEYKDSEIANSALRNLNHIDYNGRQLRVNIQENDKPYVISNENHFKASRDISYIKETQDEIIKMNTILTELSDEQKLLLLNLMRNLMLKDEKAFTQLLEHQNESTIDAILDLQKSFIDKYHK